MSTPNFASSDPKIIVALDFNDQTLALDFVDRLDSSYCRLKVGKELFTRAGPTLVEQLRSRGFDIFLDLKFHDIPNTVAAACHAAADLGVWMVNIHASGGRKMMELARERLEQHAKRPLLIAVTLLTSLDEGDISEVGLSGSVESNVARLALLAEHCGLDGVVCSPQEIAAIRRQQHGQFLLVTPGIRPAASAVTDDQKRFLSPQAAIQLGADYLVVGRPITQADDPISVLLTMQSAIAGITSNN